MDINFKQKIIIAVIGGLFILAAAYISKSENQATTMISSPIITGGSNIAIASGGNANAVSNVTTNVVDQRVFAGDGGVAINQSPNNSSNVNIQINN